MELSLPDLPGGGPFSVSRWRRQAGERVSAGEVLLEIVSPRFDWDVPAPGDGVFEPVVATGAAVAVGDHLATVGGVDAPAPEPRRRISPLAARLAAAHGVSLGRLPADRRIVRADVLAALAASSTLVADTLVAWTAAQSERAVRVMNAARAVPRGTLTAALDLRAAAASCAAMRPAWQKRESAPLDLLAFVLRGALAALVDVPECNALVTETDVRLRRAVHAAITIDDGVTPRAGVIENAERYNAVGLARRLSLLQPGGATAGGTLSIRVRPALFATDLLFDGQAASLSVGPVVPRAVAAGDAETEIHPVVHVSLTFDRRAVSDAAAQRYMERLATSC